MRLPTKIAELLERYILPKQARLALYRAIVLGLAGKGKRLGSSAANWLRSYYRLSESDCKVTDNEAGEIVEKGTEVDKFEV